MYTKTTETGQLWRLGNHLLYCGDSSSQVFRWLSMRAEASFAFVDPPHFAKVAQWDRKLAWEYDYLIDCAPIVAVTPNVTAIDDFMCTTNMPYKWSMCYKLRKYVPSLSWVYVALFATASIYRCAQDFKWVETYDLEDGKPLEMLLHLIQLFTQLDQSVINPFLGSGTTLIACEQTGRVCIGAEQDLDRCTSIIRRWELHTHKEAELY